MQRKDQYSSVDEVKDKLFSAYLRSVSFFKKTKFLHSLIILFTAFTVLVLLEQSLYLSVTAKSIILIAILLVAGYVSFIKGRNEQFINFESFYREFSRTSGLPELKDALDLQHSSTGNRELVDAAIIQSLRKVEPEILDSSLSEYTNESKLYKTFRSSLIIGIGSFIVLTASAINLDNATFRISTFWKTYNKPNPYQFVVTPGTVTIEQGQALRVNAEFLGLQLPENVSLKIKTSIEEAYRVRPMEKTGQTFTSMPIEVYNDLEYYISMDDYNSEVYSIDVQLRPRFVELSGQIKPPPYTKLGNSQFVYPSSQIRGYKGSELTLSGKLNKDINSLSLISVEDTTFLEVQNDSTFSKNLNITKPDTLRFQIQDSTGLTNDNKFQLVITPLEDEYPFVQLIEPESNLKQVNPESLDLLYRASDDFSLTSAKLNYELKRVYSRQPITGSLDLKVPKSGAITPYVWSLIDLDLKPQDVLTFWINVQDNDGFAGHKTSSSQRITLEVPSMVEYLDDMGEKEDDISTDLEEITESFQQTREQYERFKEELKDNPENAGYEEKSELEQVQKQQEEVERQIDELNEKFEQLKEEMSRDNVLSEETQKAYEELQKLIEEIDDPAFREALEKMQEQLGKMSPEELRQAMENLEFNEELYKERLQRTIELFKKLKLTSDLDKVAKAFEDLARQEEDRQNISYSSSEQAQKQETIKEHENIKKQVNELSENTSESNKNEVTEYQDSIQQQLNELTETLRKEIEESSGSDESNQNEANSPDSEQQQNKQERIEQYKKLSESTRDLINKINQKQKQINIAGLQYVLYSILNLSLEQEDLTTLVATTENRSQAYVTYARDQQNIETIFSTLSDSLFKLSAQIPQFSNRINQKKLEIEQQLSRSLTQLTERDQSQASIASRQTLGGINEIAFMLANLLEQLQNSDGNGQGGGSGGSMQQMMEQLQQSGQQQQQLNQRLQDLINDIQGDRLSQDQMERLNQLAEQQNMIRKQLQKLQQSGEFDGDRLGSELQRMIEEMEDTINDLRGGSTDALMIERQQNILSRMLEAEQAIQERDEEDRREGQLPEGTEQPTPPELTIEELEKQIRNRLNDPNFTKFSPDYQRLIQNYFELLKELQNREIQ